jgi:hypothetical protein
MPKITLNLHSGGPLVSEFRSWETTEYLDEAVKITEAVEKGHGWVRFEERPSGKEHHLNTDSIVSIELNKK